MCEIWHICGSDNLVVDGVAVDAAAPAATETTKTVANTSLTLYYGDSLLLGGYARFKATEHTLYFIPTENNTLFIKKTIEFLAKHPDTKLCIVGTVFMNEPVTSYYESEGLHRAALVRAAFLNEAQQQTASQKGNQTAQQAAFLSPLAKIDANRIAIDDSIMTEDAMPLLSFRLIPAKQKVIPYQFEKMTFYGDNFLEGNATLQPKSAFINYSDSLRLHIKRNESTKIVINAYTIDKKQQNLAFKRAQTLHKYFMALGLLSTNIKLNITIDPTNLAVTNNLNSELINQRFDVEVNH